MSNILILMKKLKSFLFGTVPYIYCRLFSPHSPGLIYYRYIHHKGYAHHLYLFKEDYADCDPEVLTDPENHLFYVLHKGKRLYFPSGKTIAGIKKLYKALVMEQDIRSPHHYLDSSEEARGRIFLDVGAAEGLVSLEVADVAEKIYLFECDREWTEALKATFAPWAEKVVLINKSVSNRDDAESVTLDAFYKNHPASRLFLKMDIEGAERYALEGCQEIFSGVCDLKFAICAYHLPDDEQVISALLEKYNSQFYIQRGFFRKRLRAVVFKGEGRLRNIPS